MTTLLFQGGGMCPEQYDVKDENGEQVAYVRLRHGSLTVECPDIGGVVILHVREAINDGYNLQGDGCFEYEERDRFLQLIANRVMSWKDGRDDQRGDVHYFIQND